MCYSEKFTFKVIEKGMHFLQYGKRLNCVKDGYLLTVSSIGSYFFGAKNELHYSLLDDYGLNYENNTYYSKDIIVAKDEDIENGYSVGEYPEFGKLEIKKGCVFYLNVGESPDYLLSIKKIRKLIDANFFEIEEWYPCGYEEGCSNFTHNNNFYTYENGVQTKRDSSKCLKNRSLSVFSNMEFVRILVNDGNYLSVDFEAIAKHYKIELDDDGLKKQYEEKLKNALQDFIIDNDFDREEEYTHPDKQGDCND